MTPLIDGDKYYVTMCGRVFVRERKELLNGRHPRPYFRTYPEKELKLVKNNVGYLQVGMTYMGNRVTRLVHRLVASKFIPNPKGLPEVNHINLDKCDNRVSNLEWCDRTYNLDHAAKNGKKRVGSTVGTSLLSEEDVLKVVEGLSEGVPQADLGRKFGVTNHAIWRIAHGHNWSWLTGISRKVGE